MVTNAKSEGKIYKLVASACRQADSTYTLSVQPLLLDRQTDFLAGCSGWEVAVEIHSDLFGKMYHKLDEREPIATSAAMLRDALHILKK